MTRTDRALLLVLFVLLAIDMGQTLGYVARGLELNPIIGAHGERVPVIPYFVGAWLLTAYQGRNVQCFVIGCELATVARNWLA